MQAEKDELPSVASSAEWLVNEKSREAIKTMIEQADRINALLEALSLARETIARDREALYSTHFDYAVGRVNDDLGQQGIDEYDAVLAAIDRSLSGGEGGGN